MGLEAFGYNQSVEEVRNEMDLKDFEIGRIIAEHRERYIIMTEKGEFEGEITGNMRFASRNRDDFPAVGDWVAVALYDDGFSIIHRILKRTSVVKRQAVGQFGEVQIIATNIDFALLLQAVDRDFNINRLQRYLTICNSSNVAPIVVLTKTDLIPESRVAEILESINHRMKDIPVLTISNKTREGYEVLKAAIERGKTYCMLGSSGVGKSTLMNNMAGKSLMRTGAVSQSTNKGRHVTSHRELILTEGGGIFIDNPGMREVGIADTESGLETTFDMIYDLSFNCRFNDCTHTGEDGCAVHDAVERGEVDKASYENFLKMERERAYFESSLSEKRKKEKKLGKIIKEYNKKNLKQR